MNTTDTPMDARPSLVVTQKLIDARLAVADAKRYWEEACKRRDAISAARWGKGKGSYQAMRDLFAANRHCNEMQAQWEMAMQRECDLKRSLTFLD